MDYLSHTKRYYIPTRFEQVVAGHILKNIAHVPYDIPLILGIHGKPGEGKTRQSELTFQRMGVEWITISGGELEHRLAGRPGELIRERYRDASKKWDLSRNKVCVLLINDFDTGIGIWSDPEENTIFQYTVNLQNVYATLMNIADTPTIIDGVASNRIPIIITGNDFGLLHEPLVRDGRMAKFRWQPTAQEKLEVVQAIFSDLWLPPEKLQTFVERYASETFAFFADVKSTLSGGYINNWLRKQDLRCVVQTVLSQPGLFNTPLQSVTIDQLELVAQKVMSERL
jgi:hypothetical protein